MVSQSATGARGRKRGYLRVSTGEQRPDRQIAGLQAICDELHIETVSAVSAARPVFDALLDRLQPGDMLVVWELDRAFRDVDDARMVAFRLMSRGVRIQIVETPVDPSDPDDLFSYTIKAAVAELERLKISKRTREGLAVARANGKRLGRPRKLSDRQLEVIRAELARGAMIKDLAARYGLKPWSVTRALKRAE